MADLKRPVSMTLDRDDVTRILSEALCRYGPLDELRVIDIIQDDRGDFSISLEPCPTETETA